MEADLRNIVEEFSDIVEVIEKLEISEEEQVSKLKARLNLYDGTILWVREIRLKKVIQAYSYYWLRPDQTIIVGWDNAPHHKEVESFPHHKHIGNKIDPSQEKNLRSVLSFIKGFLV
ncbi:MAG: hypothetical protein J7K15_12775 [Deltaproteobacteria bacterium]|nr:hypothetical protein [Deltaproteobacteria bacterium]